MNRDVTLQITLTPDDVDVLQRIWNRWGYAVDETGIIQHILREYDEVTNGGKDAVS